MKRILIIVLSLIAILSLIACEPIDVNPKDDEPAAAAADGPKVDDPYANKVNIKIDVKDFGEMTFELYPDLAPVTVENFLQYVDRGFYDGLTFHRIMKGFMIQGGDPNGNGTGSGDRSPIKGEFSENGYNNPLSHQFGVISMARTSISMDSATSQFFICNADASVSLDGKYAAFGKITSGEDVLTAISNVEVEPSPLKQTELSHPVETVIINSITRMD
ncbi:MAG: peptidylprolyl isomerase [Clostridia bacterium]|nr:peptidylprolyl isomerase [Clostridia bacterium]